MTEDVCARCHTSADELAPGDYLRGLTRYADNGGYQTEEVCGGCCTKIERGVVASADDVRALQAFALAATDALAWLMSLTPSRVPEVAGFLPTEGDHGA